MMSARIHMPSDPKESLSKESSLANKYVQIFFVVALYWFVSISMVFINKNLLSEQQDLTAPFFITWFQCLVTIACCYGVYGLSLIFPRHINFPKPEISLRKCMEGETSQLSCIHYILQHVPTPLQLHLYHVFLCP